MGKSSPTSRTLHHLRKQGHLAQVVERWLPRCKIRQDLFGCIDIVAITPRPGGGWSILGIQATSAGNHAARLAKAAAEPRLGRWLLGGGRFEVWSWGKKGPRGKRKTWTLRVQELTCQDVQQPE